MIDVWKAYYRRNRKRLFDFADDDVIWKIMEKCGMNQSEIRKAIMALAYTYIHELEDEDKVYRALCNGFKEFEIEITPLQNEEFRSAFKLRPSRIQRLLRRLFRV